MCTRTLRFLLLSLFAIILSNADLQAFQCGPVSAPPMVPVCNRPIVPLAPCCQPSALFPPPPPIDAPVIVLPEPIPYGACYQQASLVTPPPPSYLYPAVQPTSVRPLPLPPRRAKLSNYSPSNFMKSSKQAYGRLSVR
jgi:hypothetical protein